VREAVRIGIDVGGTNTDGVLMSGTEVLTSTKAATSQDVRSGVVETVTRLLEDWKGPRDRIEAVMIGTTQFVNAFVERRGLEPVAVFRIALPRGKGVPPMAGWPRDLVESLGAHIYMVRGGAFYTGREYIPLDEEGLRQAALDAHAKGLRSAVICATFAPMRPELEVRAAAIVSAAMPDTRITLSAEVGGLGLIDRENASIINASLALLSRRVVTSLTAAFHDADVRAPIYLSQNDGTLITTEIAERFPILTCSAGPTNSIRGAAFLTNIEDAIVADIGGTTTDIGFLSKGFPRETTAPNHIGGVRTNLRMPDVLSIGLGGGSILRNVGDGEALTIGPDSVGFRLREQARVFGGNTLTATDIAVRAGQAKIGDASRVAHLPDSLVATALDRIHHRIEEAIDQVKTSARAMPLILVGGGHILVSRQLRGASEVLRPRYAEVANAVGAAIALVSGRVERMYDLAAGGRAGALAAAKNEAIAAAVQAGAQPGAVEIIDVSEMPMTHMKAGSVQIRVRAAGPLAALASTAKRVPVAEISR
jgi:N-methylhydantoinase A/oxoprolinase/acetone carboxylase beta subunit